MIMAIYHLEAKIISRGVGRSACAASAYLSCSAIYNEYDGIQHDYTRKGGLVWEQVFLPEFAPPEWKDRAVLWNAVEENEKTKDSRLAREFVVALPIELGTDDWKALLTEFIQMQFVSDGMCADVAIHNTDGHNPHAHIMLTVRPLNEDGTWQYKTEKEYLCVRNGEERGFTAVEFKEAQKDGWEKQYQYKVGKKKEYLPPSQADGLERASKYPKSTKYGRQNPISERWNSEEQFVLWREAWAETANRYLERAGREERIDHRSHAERGLDEQPTIHEGAQARAMEAKGFIADRCELNRQIKADNALVRSLKATVQKLTEAVKDTVSSLAAAMEALRENMIVFRFGLLHIRRQRKKLTDYLVKANPLYRDYTDLSKQIREKRSIRADMQKELNALPVLNILKRHDLKAQIQTLSEELSELESEALTIVHGFQKDKPEEMKAVKADIADTEKAVTKYSGQEETLTTAIDKSKAEFDGLKERAARFDPDELTVERLRIRPSHEDTARRRMREALHGGKPGLWDFTQATNDADRALGEINLVADYKELLRQRAFEKQVTQKGSRQKHKKPSERDSR